MKTAITKKLRAGTAFVCSLAVVAAAAAVGFPQTEVQASISNPPENDSTEHYYVPATLYDYKYDTEVNPSYRYTYSQKWYEDKLGGDRWQNGSQVPFENINRAISDYYKTNHASDKWPGLYFGNFWGSSSDCWKLEEKQYTYGLVDNSQQTKYYDTTEGYKNFWVFANNAPKAYDGYTAVQGLVDDTLTGGNISQKSVALPQFDDTFINSTPYAEKYEVGNGFPFNKGSNGYYYFNSLTDYNRRYDYTTGNFVVENGNYTKNYRSDNGITSGERGFYPFNQKAFEGADRKDVNYGFGMRLDFKFSISDSGKTGDDNTIFEFSGDDDVWVFIDNKLVLDLGGDHARVGGKINFCTGSVEVYDKYIDTPIWNPKYDVSNPGATNARADACDNYSTTLTAKLNKNLKGDGEHTMTVFYMERGMFESNLYIRFNFVPTDVKKPTSNENQLIVREKTEFEGVNSGLLSYTKAAADKDAFDYTIESRESGAGETPNPNSFPTFKDVFRTNTDAVTTPYGTPTTQIADNWGKGGGTSSGTGTGVQYIYIEKHPNNCVVSGDSYSLYLYQSSGSKNKWINMKYCPDYKTGSGDTGHYYYQGEITNDDLTTYDKFIVVAYTSSQEIEGEYWGWHVWDNYGQTKYPSSDGLSLSGYNTSKYIFHTKSNELQFYGSNSIPQNDGGGDNYYADLTKTTSLSAGVNGALVNIPFGLDDPFATESITGITSSTGHFKLLYDESASFDKQFTKYNTSTPTVITVKQGVDVYNRTADSVVVESDDINTYHQLPYDDTHKRALASYYETEVIATDTDGNIIGRDYLTGSGESSMTATNTYFRFQNKDTDTTSDAFSEGEKAVKITETFVNTVKTNKIKITKSLASGTDSQSFKFKITFTDVFGASGVDVAEADYKNIEYNIGGNSTNTLKLSDEGTLTIKAGETAWITGIPVGTRYTVTEIYEGTGYTKPTITNGTGTVSTTTNTDSTVGVTNTPDASDKLKLKITKRWINADEGLGAGGLDSETLKVLIQRKAKSETAWTDYDTITLTKTNQTSAPSGETTDYVWTYTATDVTLLKQKAANDPYTYRVQEFSQDGSALLLNDGALYTPHCTVQYFTGTQNADDFNANDIIPFSIVNTFDIPASIPKAGAEGTGKIIVFGITAITLAGAALMIYKKKIEDGYVIKKGRYMK